MPNEESLLVLSRIVDDANCSSIIRDRAVFDHSKIISVIAATIAMHPF